MKDIKAAVSPIKGTGKAILRIFLAITFGGSIACAIIMGSVKFLEYCLVPAGTLAVIEKWLWEIGVPLCLVIVAVYVSRTWRRRYAYSYMQHYVGELHGNGCSECPRCGSSVSEHTGVKTRRVHVGDKVTTTHYSDGSKTENREAIYENQNYNYIYHRCNNPACSLTDDDWDYGDMPFKMRDLRVLILKEKHPKVDRAISTIKPGRIFVQIFFIGLLVAAIVIGGLVYRNNNDRNYGTFGGNDMADTQVSAPLGDAEKALLSDARAVINNADEYTVRIVQPGGFLKKEKVLIVTYFEDEKFGSGITYEFKGLKTDTELDDRYTVMTHEQQVCIFNDEDNTIYPPDSEYYQTHYEALMKWEGKTRMLALLDAVTVGELRESNYPWNVLYSENIRMYIADNGEVHIMDETGDSAIRYTFCVEDTQKPYDYADYRPLGAVEETSGELQKILNKLGYYANVEWYVNDVCVGEVDVADNGDGSYTVTNFTKAMDNLEKGRYVLYPNEQRYEYYKYTNPDLYVLADTPEKYTESSNPATYKLLCDLRTKEYVKAHINLDNAEKRSVLGLETTYTEDFGDGKKAVLEVEITGMVNFEYYESEGTYVHIFWYTDK